jgi:hypothetical protein
MNAAARAKTNQYTAVKIQSAEEIDVAIVLLRCANNLMCASNLLVNKCGWAVGFAYERKKWTDFMASAGCLLLLTFYDDLST